MNHVRNITEMLNFTNETRNMTTSGYSSPTDSQLFFGSQLWPENSESLSQESSLSSTTSQQSSQEGSELRFSSSYENKPLLFGNLKEKNRDFRVVEKFEEDRDKAKEKNDSDHLDKGCQHARETLNNIQQLVAGTEKNVAMCEMVLKNVDKFTSTVQNNLIDLKRDISHQFETLENKLNSHKEVMTELEERVKKSGDTTAEFGTNLESLKRSLRKEQEKERNMHEEALKLLSTLVSDRSAKPGPQRVMMDSSIQTSPGLERSLSNNPQDNKLEGKQLTGASCNLEHKQIEAPPQDPCRTVKRKQTGLRQLKKTPPVPSLRKKRTISDENRKPVKNCNKQRNTSTPLCELNTVTIWDSLDSDSPIPVNKEKRRSYAVECFITPQSCWSHDSNSSVFLVGAEPISEKLSTSQSKAEIPARPGGFWHLFDMGCDSNSGF